MSISLLGGRTIIWRRFVLTAGTDKPSTAETIDNNAMARVEAFIFETNVVVQDQAKGLGMY